MGGSALVEAARAGARVRARLLETDEVVWDGKAFTAHGRRLGVAEVAAAAGRFEARRGSNPRSLFSSGAYAAHVEIEAGDREASTILGLAAADDPAASSTRSWPRARCSAASRRASASVSSKRPCTTRAASCVTASFV